ncbi:hypothetical protein [Kribbella sp. CA-294648]|uniref:hypothetical protein n=1 Tax=Kribbella sp. CA-294648 TaxID=3239948 RepID=UPI003D9236FC
MFDLPDTADLGSIRLVEGVLRDARHEHVTWIALGAITDGQSAYGVCRAALCLTTSLRRGGHHVRNHEPRLVAKATDEDVQWHVEVGQ